MQGFADFIDSLLGGALLVALSLALGGVVWTLAVLRPWRPAAERLLVGRALGLTALGAAALVLVQAAKLGIKAFLLTGYLGPAALVTFTATLQFRAGTARAAGAAALAVATLWLRARPTSRERLAAVGLLAGLVTVTGAWLVHAAGRLETRAALMTLTVLHQLAAAVWAGGLMQLAALWALARREPVAAALWPVVVARFSRLALGAVAALVIAGVPLAVLYVGSIDGLVGTGYGSLVVTKVALLGVVLGLAGVNLRVARARGRAPATDAVRRQLPYLAEAETILVVILLFVAASLSAQPPPVDGGGERATWPELVEVFRPKWPALRSPPVAAKLADAATPATLGAERTTLAYSWSNYSHNVAGLFLLAMSVVTLAAWRRPAWGRYAPLGFVGLAVFVFLRTSASEGTWPFGPTGVWENAMASAEALQHRIGAGLALALGVVEWRAHSTSAAARVFRYVFPLLAAVGSVVLLTHAHTPFEPKSDYLIQVTHTVMGTLAVLMACGRWLELRTGPPLARTAGAVSAVAMLLLALVLVFYREANVVVPLG